MPGTPFAELATASRELAATRSRLAKRRILVDLLKRLAPAEIAPAVAWLVEAPLCGPLGFGPAHLWELARSPAAARPSVTLDDVEATLAEARRGGREETLSRVPALFERLTEDERALFVGALTGSLRQGSLGGVMLTAIAELATSDEATVRRAAMVHGSIAAAADALLGPRAVPAGAPPALELFRPLAPMLASPAESIDEALAGAGDAQVEWKIDGVRAQVHKKGDRVAVYSRQGNDITPGVRSLAPVLGALGADALILDGEIALVGADGVTRPFQDSFSAIASGGAATAARPGDHLRIYLFDCLHRDGVDLVDQPLSARLASLEAVAPRELLIPKLRVTGAAEARRFYDEALAVGHEGVVVKDLSSPYRLGARGRAWQKVKEFTTVDLVILAAEWGSGRRKGFLSNLHLGARAADGGFCMVGKTFKGLTDAMLRFQTEKLEALAVERRDHVVFVRPELVVEIRFNDVQRSPRYPGKIALRFARVVRYREDKTAAEIEPLEALVARLPPGGAPAEPARPAPQKKRQLSLFDD